MFKEIYDLASKNYSDTNQDDMINYWMVVHSFNEIVSVREKIKAGGLGYLELIERHWINNFSYYVSMYFYNFEYSKQFALAGPKLNAKKYAAIERNTENAISKLQFNIAMALQSL